MIQPELVTWTEVNAPLPTPSSFNRWNSLVCIGLVLLGAWIWLSKKPHAKATSKQQQLDELRKLQAEAEGYKATVLTAQPYPLTKDADLSASNRVNNEQPHYLLEGTTNPVLHTVHPRYIDIPNETKTVQVNHHPLSKLKVIKQKDGYNDSFSTRWAIEEVEEKPILY